LALSDVLLDFSSKSSNRSSLFSSLILAGFNRLLYKTTKIIRMRCQ
jgi:hypothetical protein